MGRDLKSIKPVQKITEEGKCELPEPEECKGCNEDCSVCMIG